MLGPSRRQEEAVFDGGAVGDDGEIETTDEEFSGMEVVLQTSSLHFGEAPVVADVAVLSHDSL